MPVGLKPIGKLLPIKGIRLAAVAAKLRYSGRPDLVLIECTAGTRAAAVFTTNRYAAAPVTVAKEHLNSAKPRALIINAGQANAGTGEKGIEISRASCLAVASQLGCDASQVLPFSTGVIGNIPPIEKIENAIPALVAALDEDKWNQAASAIMTTDTLAKGLSLQCELGGKTVTVTGIVKGSGMIHPNMATMLAYVATDAAVQPELLNACWQQVTKASFGRVTVDGDTSTNDAAVVLASGAAGNPELNDAAGKEYDTFKQTLLDVCTGLAQAIIRDGEGATKFMSVIVERGETEEDCVLVAQTVALSPLVKTAFFASDPNWGRILAAVGRAPISRLDIDKVDLFLGEVRVATGGAIDAAYTEAAGKAEMQKEDIDIRIVLNAGQASATVWTCDLSHEYVRINAEYRS